MKKVLCVVACLAIMSSAGGCSSKDETPISNLAQSTNSESSISQTLTKEEIKAQEDYLNSTPANDTDIGLKTIKLDIAANELSDDQKKVIQYFDNDYFNIYDYEFLRRYPQVFDNTQVNDYGTVYKVLSQNGKDYEILFWSGDDYTDPERQELLLLKGSADDVLYLEGDYLCVYGCCQGIDTIEVDGEKLILPVIDVYDAYMYSAATNVNDARRAKRLPGHQYLDYLVKRPLIKNQLSSHSCIYIANSRNQHTI